MMSMDEDTRRTAQDILSILVQDNHPTDSQYSLEFPGVDADEVHPGIIIGNK